MGLCISDLPLARPPVSRWVLVARHGPSDENNGPGMSASCRFVASFFIQKKGESSTKKGGRLFCPEAPGAQEPTIRSGW
jgi:hypothetical protein